MTNWAQTRTRAAFRGLTCSTFGRPLRPVPTCRVGIGLLGTCLVVPALLSGAGPANAQAADNAPLAFVDISTGLRYDDDTPGTEETAFETRLGAGYFLATPSQRLSLEGEFLFEVVEEEADFTDPSVRLSYAIFDRGTELSFDLSYSALARDDRDIDEDFDAADLTEDAGTLERIDARVGLVTGRDAPFGTSTELAYREDNFTDGAVEDDQTLISFSSTLLFIIDPQVTLRAIGFASRERTDDAIDTVETVYNYGLGADFLIDPVWSATFDIGFREVEIESTAGRNVIDGTEAALTVTRDMPNGALDFEARRAVVNTGFEDTLRLRRTLTLPNGADVSLSGGAVIFEGADPVAIYGATYANEIRPGSRFSLALDRTGAVSADDENIIRTTLNGTFVHDLTEASSLSLNANLLQVEDSSLAGTDDALVDLSLSYRYAVTEDWILALQASRELLFTDGVEEERNTTLSLGLERRFSFRP